MDTKTIIIIAIASGGILGLMAWGYGNTAGPTATELGARSALTASETLYDFGRISMRNGKVNHLFQIKNPTASDIIINNLQTSCMCTNAYIALGASKEGPFGMPGMGGMTRTNQVIKARGTLGIDVVFDPAAHGPAGVGTIDRFVYATEKSGGTLQLEVKAVVTP